MYLARRVSIDLARNVDACRRPRWLRSRRSVAFVLASHGFWHRPGDTLRVTALLHGVVLDLLDLEVTIGRVASDGEQNSRGQRGADRDGRCLVPESARAQHCAGEFGGEFVVLEFERLQLHVPEIVAIGRV